MSLSTPPSSQPIHPPRKFIPSPPPNSDVLPDGFFDRLKRKIHSKRFPLSRRGQFGMFFVYTSVPMFLGWISYKYAEIQQEKVGKFLEQKHGYTPKDREEEQRKFQKQVKWILKQAREKPIGQYDPYPGDDKFDG